VVSVIWYGFSAPISGTCVMGINYHCSDAVDRMGEI